MVIVPARLHLDIPVLSESLIGSDIYFYGAGAYGEYVDQSLPGPCFNIESVYTTALDVSGHSHGKKIGAALGSAPFRGARGEADG